MRTYAQDTALPGGKYEEGDEDEEGTAVSLGCFRWPAARSVERDTDNRGAKHTKK